MSGSRRFVYLDGVGGKSMLVAALAAALSRTDVVKVEERVAVLGVDELESITKQVMKPQRARDAFDLKRPKPERNRKARRADKRRKK